MVEMELPSTPTKQPQISEMFQKFALAFKAKTYELLTGEEEEVGDEEFVLDDSADEEFIPNQKVIIIKPDSARIQNIDSNSARNQDPDTISARIQDPSPFIDTHLAKVQEEGLNLDTCSARNQDPNPFVDTHSARNHELGPNLDTNLAGIEDSSKNIDAHVARIEESSLNRENYSARNQELGPNIDPHLARSIIGSLFAVISSFGASYLQLQAAHVPFNGDSIEAADKALVSILQKLGEMKRNFRDLEKNLSLIVDFGGGFSFLEFQVQENQSKLRALETMVNQLQSDIDCKDDEVLVLRKKLHKVEISNKVLLKKLGFRYDKGIEIKLSFRVFDCMLSDCVKALRRFTKLLIDLMRKAGWDLEKAANSVYSDVSYAKDEHRKYVFLSYISFAMFRGFNLDDYGIDEEEVEPEEVDSNGNDSVLRKNDHQKVLIEHASCNPMEVLSNNPKCNFSRFCEKKYELLIHPSMESSIFSNVDRKEAVLSSWKSLQVFYESFVRMSSSIWLLHKLGYCFDPVVEIFQVERGTDFSIVYMEDVTKKGASAAPNSRPKVAFTVVPGFKVGRTVTQSQVYLMGSKCTE